MPSSRRIRQQHAAHPGDLKSRLTFVALVSECLDRSVVDGDRREQLLALIPIRFVATPTSLR
jgi:hypothetical protein